MQSRTAFVDERLLAGEYGTGDFVRKTGLRDFTLTPYIGRVLYSNVDTGKVQVQWPWGAEQENPSELVLTHDSHAIPPLLADQSYSTWEQSRNVDGKAMEKTDAKWRKSLASRVVEQYEEKTSVLWRAACEAWHCQMPEIEAFMKMATVFGDEFGDDAVRLTVGNVYEAGRHLAIYWKDNGRKYRTTQQEQKTKKFSCPRCKGLLRPRTFRQGQKTLQCKSCGFNIHPQDLLTGKEVSEPTPENPV